MIEPEKIEALLEKYYRGETSTAEEEILRDFFTGGDVPEHLEAEAGLFRFFNLQKEDFAGGDSLSGEMESRLVDMIPDATGDATETRRISGGMKLRYYWIGSAAAVALILIGIFIDMRIRQNNSFEVRQDTYEDPYLAYVEAKRVLYLVAASLNQGTRPLKNIEKLDSGVDYMHPVFSFGAGIQHLEHLGTIEQTRKKISN